MYVIRVAHHHLRKTEDRQKRSSTFNEQAATGGLFIFSDEVWSINPTGFPIFKKTAFMAKLARIKTTETDASVDEFISKLTSEQQRNDTRMIMKMMQKASGEKPKMWGPSIIGFGNRRYKSPKTGREVEWLRMGFSPRKANLALYLLSGLSFHADALKKLGKHKTGAGCLYVNKLSDIDLNVLEKMIQADLKQLAGS